MEALTSTIGLIFASYSLSASSFPILSTISVMEHPQSHTLDISALEFGQLLVIPEHGRVESPGQRL